jgi:hypothetical protein
MQGRIVDQRTWVLGQGSQRIEIATRDWSAGLYMVQLQSNDGLHTKKWLIE